MTPSDKYLHQSVYVSPAWLKGAIIEAAERQGLSVSEWWCQAAREKLRREDDGYG